jgi:hypothetical protein
LRSNHTVSPNADTTATNTAELFRYAGRTAAKLFITQRLNLVQQWCTLQFTTKQLRSGRRPIDARNAW